VHAVVTPDAATWVTIPVGAPPGVDRYWLTIEPAAAAYQIRWGNEAVGLTVAAGVRFELPYSIVSTAPAQVLTPSGATTLHALTAWPAIS
jgi:hypothetical protein